MSTDITTAQLLDPQSAQALRVVRPRDTDLLTDDEFVKICRAIGRGLVERGMVTITREQFEQAIQWVEKVRINYVILDLLLAESLVIVVEGDGKVKFAGPDHTEGDKRRFLPGRAPVRGDH